MIKNVKFYNKYIFSWLRERGRIEKIIIWRFLIQILRNVVKIWLELIKFEWFIRLKQ